jgi:Uma2 family endonuclease
MNAPIGLKLDKKAFLHWVQKQERRFELKDGEVVVHPGGSRQHAALVGRLVTVLSNRLDPDVWTVCPTEFAVEIGPDIRYPDILVERVHDDRRALSTENPIVLIEVLSPSSIGTDMTEKLAEYTSLASLEACIVASQDEPICWVWQRGGAERSFPQRPQEIAGRDTAIEIAALGISLPLAEIFRGIGAARARAVLDFVRRRGPAQSSGVKR